MEEQRVTFETAKIAKEKGFDIPQSSYYNFSGYYVKPFGDVNNTHRAANGRHPSYLAPTQSLLQKWLREKHKIGVYVMSYQWPIKKYEVVIDTLVMTHSGYDTYEKALEVGLQEALKIVQP